MARYMITYLGGDQPTDPEAGKQHFAKYQAWLTALGKAATSPMNPFKETRTVHPDGTITPGSSIAMSGYTILEVDSMEKALNITRDCPFLEIGGSIEVSELMEIPA